VAQLPQFARDELPRILLKEVTSHLYKGVLQKLHLFASLSDDVLMDLALCLKPLQVPPCQLIYKEGDWGESMYFLTKGCIELSIILMANSAQKDMGLGVVRFHELSHCDTLRHTAAPCSTLQHAAAPCSTVRRTGDGLCVGVCVGL